MINGRSIVFASCLFLLGTTLVSCGGGSGSDFVVTAGGEASNVTVSSGNLDAVDGNQEPAVAAGPSFEELMADSEEADAFGTVIDSAVSGLRYKSGGHYGVTDSDGKYGYIDGELVEFFIGDIAIGTAIEPVSRITPYEMASGNEVVAMDIARFLQTLDNDADPENGIHINDAVHLLAEGKALDFSSADWQETVHQLTSATEAGARELLTDDTAMGHLSSSLHQVILSLGEDAESLLNESTCETDSQCKWTSLSSIPSYCSTGDKRLVYSEVDADLPAFEMLEAQRVYLIDIREKLKESVWGPDRTRGLCVISTSPTWAVCGESNHCEITTSLPGF
jgi:hypothetical protein